MMEEAGYEIVPFGSEAADVYIINTCSVTNIADRKSRQMIHKARKLNENAVIVATGCYVQGAKDEVDGDVDLVIGNNEKGRLIEFLDEYYKDMDSTVGYSDISKALSFDSMNINKSLEHTRAYVKIQDGCNRFCSYCIIPYVRGRIRSRKPEDIKEEVRRLASNGCKEVVLTGIHLSSYGKDLDEDITLLDAIKSIHDIDGIRRIRLGSLEPMIVTEDFAKELSSCTKVCPHFHLSLQSGCDDTLMRMNRKYTSDEFYEGCKILRKYYNRPAITTDVIVGFPGETEEEFNITEKFLEKVHFYEMHIFKYSRRKGTVADKMPGQHTEREKTVRSEKLIELEGRMSEEYRRSFLGTRAEVLFEEENVINGKKYITGYTTTYIRVAAPLEADNAPVTNEIRNVSLVEMIDDKTILAGL